MILPVAIFQLLPITIQTENRFNRIEYIFNEVVRRCLTIGTELSCSNSSLFHCSLSSKCISYHRLVDGFQDFYYGEDESYLACQLNDINVDLFVHLIQASVYQLLHSVIWQLIAQKGEDELISR